MGGRKWRAACGAAFLWLVLGEKPKEGGRGLHCEGLGLGFFFLFFQNCPPSLLYVLETPIYRQKCCQVTKLSPSIFFFCKFDFFYCFRFFLSTSTRNEENY